MKKEIYSAKYLDNGVSAKLVPKTSIDKRRIAKVEPIATINLNKAKVLKLLSRATCSKAFDEYHNGKKIDVVKITVYRGSFKGYHAQMARIGDYILAEVEDMFMPKPKSMFVEVPEKSKEKAITSRRTA